MRPPGPVRPNIRKNREVAAASHGLDIATGTMIDEELEKQYSPKCWSTRYPSHLAGPKFCEFTEKESEEAKATIPCQLGLQYGPTEGQRLDIFGGDELPKDAPIVVFIHGGYWQFLNRESSSFFVPPIYKAGARAAVIGYDLAPQVSLTDIVEQINSGVKYLLEYAHKQGSSGLIFAGHCAGATLIFTTLTSKWFRELPKSDQLLFKGSLYMSGVYDLAPLIYTTKNDAIKLTPQEIVGCSSLGNINLLPSTITKSHKFVIVRAEHDSPEFIKQTEAFAKGIQEASDNVDFFAVPEVDHYSIAEKLTEEDYVLVQKLIQLYK